MFGITVMMKKWIARREEVGQKFLKILGLTSFQQLLNCTILVNVSYGNQDSGCSALVKAQQVNINERHIEFVFEKQPIEICLDAMSSGLGGDLNLDEYNTNSKLEITDLTFDGKSWSATVIENGKVGCLSQNLDVKIVTG